MWHTMPISFLILAAISVGTSTDVADVSVTGRGAFIKAKVEPHVKNIPVPNSHPVDVPLDVPGTPFEIGPNPQDESLAEAPKANIPVSGTPFEVDASYSPFEIDDSTSVVEAKASIVNDSPFALESEMPPMLTQSSQNQAGSSPFVVDKQAAPSPAAPKLPTEDGPFMIEKAEVVDKDEDAEDAKLKSAVASKPAQATQGAGKEAADEDEDAEDAKLKAEQDARFKNAQERGTLRFVKSGEGTPGKREETTSFVMMMKTTTGRPPTSTRMQFELGESLVEPSPFSLLEQSPGQKFIDIPGTPFEVERHAGRSLGQRKKTVIELRRPDAELPSPGVLVQTEPKLVSAQRHVPQRLMRSQDAQDQDPIGALPVDMGLQPALMMQGKGHVHNRTIGGAKFGDNPTTVNKSQSNATADDTQDEAKNSAAANAPKINSQNAVDTPGTHPSVQLPPSDSDPIDDNGTSAQTAATNSTGSIIGDIVNRVAGGANATPASDVTTNVTGPIGNVTLHKNKRVSASGAFVSITLGLIITIFLLGIVLCVLNAGRKEAFEQEEKEPPRPTPSYRQMMIAQQQPEVSNSASPPAA